MFDIGFWELALIGVVALLVIGPERLPGVARAAGLWFGKARRFVGGVKADIERELRAEELKRIMDEQARSAGLHEIIEETKADLDETRQEIGEAGSEIEQLGTALKEERPSDGKDRPTDRKPGANDER